MLFDCILVHPKPTESAKETVVVNAVIAYTQKIGQGAGATKLLGDMNFTVWLTEPGNDQHTRYNTPRNFRMRACQNLVRQSSQAKLLEQFESQPDIPELARAFRAHPVNIDLDPLSYAFI